MPTAHAAQKLDPARAIAPAYPEQISKDMALKRYAPLVKYVVDKIATGLPKSIERGDLTNAAMIGLFDALEKYDESRGTKFETYAIWRIKGAVLDELRALDWASRTTRRKAREMERVCSGLDQKLGRAATEQEMADAMGLSQQEFVRVLEEVRGTVLLSLDQSLQVDDDHDLSGLADIIEDKSAEDALHLIEEEESRRVLLDLINNLTEQERLVVALYYYEEMTLRRSGKRCRSPSRG
jgi:RNA polymerase sigma factor FliA